MSDQWETFCDVSYYHMWRLRLKTERGWNDGFHINTKAEAEGLCELLNKLERELTEAREQCNNLDDQVSAAMMVIRGLERERDEALAYADKLAAGLPEGMLPKDVEVLRDANLALAVERDSLQEQLDAALMLGKMQERRHARELEQVREQRDRLAEALRELCETLLTDKPRDITELLNKAGDALAAVKL
jgi:chromosome segregation ATPase